MANEVLQKVGTQIIFADHAADFAGGTAKTSLEVATATDVQIDLTGLIQAAGRESAQFDFGATRSAAYSVMCTLEFEAAPTTGETVSLYLAPSPETTATDGNPQQIDGADAAAPSGPTTLDELLAACMFIGAATLSADLLQTMWVSTFQPPERYGILIVVNNCATADFRSTATAMDETHIVFNPITDEIQ